MFLLLSAAVRPCVEACICPVCARQSHAGAWAHMSVCTRAGQHVRHALRPARATARQLCWQRGGRLRELTADQSAPTPSAQRRAPDVGRPRRLENPALVRRWFARRLRCNGHLNGCGGIIVPGGVALVACVLLWLPRKLPLAWFSGAYRRARTRTHSPAPTHTQTHSPAHSPGSRISLSLRRQMHAPEALHPSLCTQTDTSCH